MNVSKETLIFTAGFVWIGVGILLISMAYSWLLKLTNINIYLFSAFGIFLALLVHNFGFVKIVDKNLKRIFTFKDKTFFFSFIPIRSYIIIIIMITMGAIMRHSSIPKQYLAILYIGMGLALGLSSIRYFKAFIKEIK